MSINDQYPTATSRDRVFLAIAEEREAQDKQWGGPAHDDLHVRLEWVGFIGKQLTFTRRAVIEDADNPGPIPDSRKYREHLVKIAALAVAAIESLDRKTVQHTSCPTCKSPSPHLHPAMQHEGEVQPCRDAWHSKVYCAELGNNEHGS